MEVLEGVAKTTSYPPIPMLSFFQKAQRCTKQDDTPQPRLWLGVGRLQSSSQWDERSGTYCFEKWS